MKKPKIGARICEWCGKPYMPTSNCQKYCKISCGTQASTNWKMKEPPKFWVCSYCDVRNKLKINIFEEQAKWRAIKCSACGEYRLKMKGLDKS